MKRLYINSYLDVVEACVFNWHDPDSFIIQIEEVGDNIVVEHCHKEDILDLQPFTTNLRDVATAHKGDRDKINEYMAVELRNDPFGRYSGKTLGDIFMANDTKWIERCIAEMRNDYIKDRVIYLKENLKR